MSDQDRIKELKKTPHLFQQRGYGCCGAASAIMGLLVHAPAEVDVLYKCLHDGEVYRGIKGSDDVQVSLGKRLSINALDENAANYLDIKLAVGLLLILKRALKESKNGDLWKECEAFSTNWENWQKGEKISVTGAVPPFSAKHGDIALTTEVTKFLLGMVGFTDIQEFDLISNEDLQAHGKDLTTLTSHKPLVTQLTTLVNSVNGPFKGALVGVAKKEFVVTKAKETAKYDHVAHWVYLPQGKAPPKIFDTKVWTWGAEWTLQKLITDPRAYVPRVALAFKGWKAK